MKKMTNSPRRATFNILIGLSIYSIFCLAASSRSDYGVGAVEDKDVAFTVSSVITTNKPEDIDEIALSLTESYSSSQKRAKIQIQRTVSGIHSDYYYDLESLSLLRVEESKLCEVATIDNLYKFMFGPHSVTFDKILKTSSEDSRHVIGPARLLILIVQQSDNIKLTSSDKRHKVRNMLTYKMKLNLELAGSEMQLTIYSAELSIREKDQLPRRVELHYDGREDGDKIIIDYLYHQKFAPSSIHLEMAQKSIRDHQRIIDMFAIPRAIGCSYHLKRNDLFTQYDSSSVKLSFETHQMDKTYSRFIAYDGMSNTMRVDRLTGGKGEDANEYVINMMDFTNNHRYVTVQKDESLRADDAVISEHKERVHDPCILTKLLPVRGNQMKLNRLSLSRLILGADKFAYLGKGRVRNIDVRIYEGEGSLLPFWLTQPMAMTHEDGEDTLVEADFSTDPYHRYIVYIADDKDAVGLNPIQTDTDSSKATNGLRVVLVDIIEPKQQTQLFSLRFHNFIWDLTEAPNGDESWELFSRNNMCIPPDGTKSIMKVTMLFSESETDVKENQGRNFLWLDNWKLRNNAIDSSLAELMSVPRLMINEVETKLVSYPKRAIGVNLRIAPYISQINLVRFKGKGGIQKGSSKSSFASRISPTLAECMWFARQWPKVRFFYYHQQKLECVVDPQMVVSKSEKSNLTNWESSAVLFFDNVDQDAGDIYSVEITTDAIVKGNMHQRKSFEAYAISTKNKAIVLQNPSTYDVISPFKTDEIKFHVQNVEWKRIDDDQPVDLPYWARADSIIEGFALSESDPMSKRVSSDPIIVESRAGESKDADNNNNDDEVDDDDDDEDDEASISSETDNISLLQCQAACLEDLDCRSYSYCIQSKIPNCLISSANFRSEATRKQIEDARAKKLKRGSVVSIEMADEVISVDIVKDLRCELHNKVYLNMYEKSPLPLSAQIYNHRVYAVESPEECAEICFTESLESIEENDRISRRFADLLKNLDHLNSKQHEELSELKEMSIHSNSKFCRDFMYREETFPETLDILRKISANSKADSTKFCMTDKIHKEIISHLSLTVDSYSFDLTHLYEKKFGVALEPSELSTIEIQATKKVKNQEELNDEEIKALTDGVKEGKNYREIFEYDARTCALMCLRNEVWPQCRSFDLFTMKADNDRFRNVCILNSLIEEEAKNMSDYKATWFHNDDFSSVWHYEPRFGVSALKDELAQRASLETLNWWNRKFIGTSKMFKGSAWGFVFGWTLKFVVVLVGLASGIMINMSVYRRLLNRFGSNIGAKNQIDSLALFPTGAQSRTLSGVEDEEVN